MAYEKKTGGRSSGGKGSKGGKSGKFGGDRGPRRSEKPEGEQRGPRRFGKPEGEQRGPRRFGKPEGEQRGPRRFGKPEGERGPRRFDKPEGERRSPRRFEKPEGEQRGPRRSEKPEGEQRGPRRFGKPEGDRGPRRFGKPEGDRGPRRFGKPEGDRSPRRFEKPEGEQRGPRRFEKHDGERAPKRFEKISLEDTPKRGALGLKPEREKKTFTPHEFFIWGRRPVEAYLADLTASEEQPEAKDHKLHIIVDKAGKAPAQLRAIVELAKSFGFPVITHKNEEGEWPVAGEEGLNHQRVCLRVPAIKQHDVQDLIDLVTKAKEDGVKGCIGVVCDQIQDPRNFGAILRGAAFFGLQFAVYGKDRQALITPHVLKASAGGAFQLKLAEVVNIVRAMETLKQAGAWIVGTTLENSVPLSQIPMDRPYVVVMGNEGKGLRQDVARHCDYLTRIDGGAVTVDSLNVAVAAGVVFHALKANVPEIQE